MPKERRRADRRVPLLEAEMLLDDEWIDAENLIVEILETAELGPTEPTRIIERCPFGENARP